MTLRILSVLAISIIGLGCSSEKVYVRFKQSTHPDCQMKPTPAGYHYEYEMDNKSLDQFRIKIARIGIGTSTEQVEQALGAPSLVVPIPRKKSFGFRSVLVGTGYLYRIRQSKDPSPYDRNVTLYFDDKGSLISIDSCDEGTKSRP